MDTDRLLALVTGSARGIGAEVARQLAEAGYAVLVTARDALHALTVKLAVELRTDGIVVDAAAPGLTATAPGMEAMGARPVPEGAASVVRAALLQDGPGGTFTRDGEPLAW